VGSDIDGDVVRGAFGRGVALSSDGTILAVGSLRSIVKVFGFENEAWTQLGREVGSGDLDTHAVVLSADGRILAVGFLGDQFTHAGVVQVFEWINGDWSQLGNDIDGEMDQSYFGADVALSSDGSILAVGGPRNKVHGDWTGHVRVFEWENGAWTQMGNDIDGEEAKDQMGSSVALSSDGMILAAGSRNALEGKGHVQIFEWSNDAWNQIGDKIVGENMKDWFGGGSGVDLSSDGMIVAISSISNCDNGCNSGHVRIFEWENGAWTQLGNAIVGEAAEDRSGSCVDLSSDGMIVAVGAYANDGNGSSSGHIRIFEWINEDWKQRGNDIDGDAPSNFFGLFGALSSDGSIVAGGASGNDDADQNSGHVKVYKWI
jgi:Flp pilus assembly pilin Flp